MHSGLLHEVTALAVIVPLAMSDVRRFLAQVGSLRVTCGALVTHRETQTVGQTAEAIRVRITR